MCSIKPQTYELYGYVLIINNFKRTKFDLKIICSSNSSTSF